MKTQLTGSALPANIGSHQALVGRSRIPLDITQTVPDACTGEDVLLSVSGFLSVQLVETDNVFRGEVDDLLTGSGTGLSSGASYIFNGGDAETENFDLIQDGVQATLIEHLEFIGAGTTSDLLAEIRNHFVVNADGTITVLSLEMTSTCR